jgi:hypothetical protein
MIQAFESMPIELARTLLILKHFVLVGNIDQVFAQHRTIVPCIGRLVTLFHHKQQEEASNILSISLSLLRVVLNRISLTFDMTAQIGHHIIKLFKSKALCFTCAEDDLGINMIDLLECYSMVVLQTLSFMEQNTSAQQGTWNYYVAIIISYGLH